MVIKTEQSKNNKSITQQEEKLKQDMCKNVKNNPYDYNTFQLFFDAILLFIFSISSFLILRSDSTNGSSLFSFTLYNGWIKSTPEVGFAWGTFLTIFIYLPLYAAIFCFVQGIISLIKRFVNNRIHKKGDVLSGEIINFFDHIVRDNERHNFVTHHDYLIIKYFNPETQQEQKLLTPELNFNPLLYLGSSECNVYYYHHKAFAFDFLSVEDTNANVSLSQDKELFDAKKKKSGRINISLLLIYTIAVIVMRYLSIK